MLIPQAPSEKDELPLLSGKIEFHLREKGWRLIDKLDQGKIIYHHWLNKGHYVKLSFFYNESQEEAAKRLQKDIAQIRTEFGQGSKAEGIGDEAYVWEGTKNGQSLVNFRYGRVIVAVVGQSIDEVKDFAKRVASVIERGAVTWAPPNNRFDRSAVIDVRMIKPVPLAPGQPRR